jgi:surfactin family lipopeptide synthetase A
MSDLANRIAALSPAKQALLIQRLQRQREPGTDAQVIRRRGDAGPVPPSFAQQRLWFLDQLEPDSPLYNIPAGARIQGRLNRGALHRALEAIVARHEALRTTFATQDDHPVQVIAAPRPVALAVLDLAAHPADDREAECQRNLAAEIQRPFDLSRDLLLRATLVRLREDEHALLLVLHHIAADGWSLAVLYRELATLYGAFAQGHTAALPALSIQYADYAVWQRQWLQGAVLEAHLAYWRQQLVDLTPLELPTDRPRPAAQTFRGAHRTRILPPSLRAAIEALSRQTGGTLFMILLAAFQTLLARYTGQEDIVVGSPIAGRTRIETEDLIGFFINTLALRVDLSGNPPFRTLLGRVREVCLDAYAHQEMPFEKLVEELKPERTLSQSPLFQVMFVLQNASHTALALPDLTATPVEVESGTAKFDLTVFVTAIEEGLQTTVEYNTDLFDAATIARMAGHFQTLLAGIVADPDQRLAALPLLTDAERAQVAAWNATAREDPQACVHDGIAAQAARAPERVAVVGAGGSLTYRELEARAERLAGHLRSLGVGPDRLVGVCLERTPEMVVAVLAVLKAGGAYVPLDPAYPAARLAYMSEDAGLTVLISQRALVAAVPTRSVPLVLVDEPAATWGHAAGPAASRENLAYVIYTSGSTGQPKGVPITHRALGNLLTSMAREPGFTATDTLLAVTTLSFDIAALELFLPLSTGGTVVVATRAQAVDGVELQALLATAGVTVMQATPATWRLLLEAGWTGTPKLKILCGGEAVPRDLANRLLARAAEVWNVYGPTETTIWSSAGKVVPGEGAISIGRPIANTQMYVLDGHRNPLPAGVPGELYIGGTGLSPGYWNRPDLTAERFVADPFSADPGARLYRTGDRARWRPDGTIECLGRLDHQVKIRGFRIELGEIEAALARVDGVAQAVVVARDDTPGEKHLVAYVVPTIQPLGPSVTAGDLPVDAVPLRAATLRATLRVTLPEYMIPTSFVFLDALPRTPNGKVDRTALPAPGAEVDQGTRYVAPRTPLEEGLARIWAEVLQVDQVGVHDNFFALGGHSLMATRVLSRMRQTLRIDLPLRQLFSCPTIAGLAVAADATRPASTPSDPRIEREEITL